MALFDTAPSALRRRLAFDMGGEGVGASGNAPLEDYGQASQAGSNARKALTALKYSQFETWDRAAANDRADEALAMQRANAAAERTFRQQQLDLQRQNAEAMGDYRMGQLDNQRAIAGEKNDSALQTAQMRSLDSRYRTNVGAATADANRETGVARGLISKGYTPQGVQTYMETGDASKVGPIQWKPTATKPFNPQTTAKQYRSGLIPYATYRQQRLDADPKAKLEDIADEWKVMEAEDNSRRADWVNQQRQAYDQQATQVNNHGFTADVPPPLFTPRNIATTALAAIPSLLPGVSFDAARDIAGNYVDQAPRALEYGRQVAERKDDRERLNRAIDAEIASAPALTPERLTGQSRVTPTAFQALTPEERSLARAPFNPNYQVPTSMVPNSQAIIRALDGNVGPSLPQVPNEGDKLANMADAMDSRYAKLRGERPAPLPLERIKNPFQSDPWQGINRTPDPNDQTDWETPHAPMGISGKVSVDGQQAQAPALSVPDRFSPRVPQVDASAYAAPPQQHVVFADGYQPNSLIKPVAESATGIPAGMSQPRRALPTVPDVPSQSPIYDQAQMDQARAILGIDTQQAPQPERQVALGPQQPAYMKYRSGARIRPTEPPSTNWLDYLDHTASIVEQAKANYGRGERDRAEIAAQTPARRALNDIQLQQYLDANAAPEDESLLQNDIYAEKLRAQEEQSLADNDRYIEKELRRRKSGKRS